MNKGEASKVKVCCNKVVIDYKLVLKTMGWGSGGGGSKDFGV
jgi:hypothetical protein